MLIELWEKLRGYDKWVETQAKISRSKVERTAHNGRDGSVSYTWESNEQITWMDRQGLECRADFKVDDESPLYQFIGGETVIIRYDPADPAKFYFRELSKSRVRRFFQLTLYITIFLIILGVLVALNIATHGK